MTNIKPVSSAESIKGESKTHNVSYAHTKNNRSDDKNRIESLRDVTFDFDDIYVSNIRQKEDDKYIVKEAFGKIHKYLKKEDGTTQLVQVTTKDSKGNILNQRDYHYDKDGRLNFSTYHDYSNNTAQTIFYKDGRMLMTFPYDIIGDTDYFDEAGYDGFYDYGDRTRLDKPISETLSQKEINEINEKIKENVNAAGRGTGEAVAAALTTLIVELQKRGIMLPYYYGGGHDHNEIIAGLDPSWGTYPGADASNHRYYKSDDCTGIIAWAMETAGINCPPNGYEIANEAEHNGTIIKASEMEPGNILANDDHDILVVNTYTDSSGQQHIVCAQSRGSGATSAGATINKGEYGEAPTIYDNSGESYNGTGGVLLTDYTYEVTTVIDPKTNIATEALILKTENDVGSEPTAYQLYNMEAYYQNNQK